MKLTSIQIESLVRKVLENLESTNTVSFGNGKDKAIRLAVDLINEDYQKEAMLEREVNDQLDKIEREQTNQFERHKMFKMLKAKLADERGIVL